MKKKRIWRSFGVVVSVLVVGLSVAACNLGASGGGAQTSAEFLFECDQDFKRGRYADAYDLCLASLRHPARSRVHVAAARRSILSALVKARGEDALLLSRVLIDTRGDNSHAAIVAVTLHSLGEYAGAMTWYRLCGAKDGAVVDRFMRRAARQKPAQVDHRAAQTLARTYCPATSASPRSAENELAIMISMKNG